MDEVVDADRTEPATVEQRPSGAGAPGTAGPTGDARVDRAMGRLATLPGLAVADQVPEYEEIHRSLQDTLATVDET